MKRRTKLKIKCFILVVMMAILALLPHISSAMEQDTSEMIVELEEVQYKNIEYEVLPLGVKEEMKESEKVLYACVAVAGPGLLILGTSLYKKRKVENINYW